MNWKGIGIDIIKIARIKLENKLEDKILSKEEKSYFLKKNNIEKINFLAGRWALKEAIIKALSNKNIDFRQINIYNAENGQPKTNFFNKKILLSLSHEKDYAVAIALFNE